MALTEDHGTPSALIEVDGLSVDYWTQDYWANVVDGVTFSIAPGEAFGLVGESGCGKTTTAYGMLAYRRANSRIRRGQVRFGGKDLLRLSDRDLQGIRGRQISIVPQDPTTALSPGIRVGSQVVETLRAHHWGAGPRERRQRALDLFRRVSLPAPEQIFNKYPHQLSGGQQQRVVIAMALACDPQLVLLDEPTTGLDVTTQAQILNLLSVLRAEYNLAMLYVTHNLGVVAQICDRIGVMYAGRLVEVAPKRELFYRPRHAYTQGLIASVPRISTPSRRQTLLLLGLLRRSELPAGCAFSPRCEFVEPACRAERQQLEPVGVGHTVACRRWRQVPAFAERLASHQLSVGAEPEAGPVIEAGTLLTVRDLQAAYTSRRTGLTRSRKPNAVVTGLSFEIRPSETYALVGESGSGKTTVARALSGLLPYVSGRLELEGGHDLRSPIARRSQELLRSLQFVFQNPDASLNPRQRVVRIVGRPLEVFFGASGKELHRHVEQLLEDVHLDIGFGRRFPDELSGGERQRVALARALAASPSLLLCDEILSALDVSVQANILKLLVDLQIRRRIAYLFISHDLATVRSVAHHVGVLYAGTLCEKGTVDEVFSPPFHPYTHLLLSSVPEADPDQVMPALRNDLGLSPESRRSACPFTARCPWSLGEVCRRDEPPWRIASATHALHCHLPLDQLSDLPGLSRTTAPAPAR